MENFRRYLFLVVIKMIKCSFYFSDVPDAPERPLITSFTSRSMNLSWAHSQEPRNAPVTHFLIETRYGIVLMVFCTKRVEKKNPFKLIEKIRKICAKHRCLCHWRVIINTRPVAAALIFYGKRNSIKMAATLSLSLIEPAI